MNKDNILKENTLISVALITLVVLFFFGSDYIFEMTPDTLATWENGWLNASLDHITRNGRVIMGVFYYLFGLSRLSLEQAYKVSYILSIIFIIISIYLLQNKMAKYIKEYLLRILISIAVVVNPFIIEQYMCFEKGLFALAILFTILSSIKFIDYLEKEKNKDLYYSLFFILMSVFTYQAVIALMLGICIPFIFHFYKNRKYISKTLILIVFFGFANIANFLFLRFFGQTTRIGATFDVTKIIDNFLSTIFDLMIMPVSMLMIMPRWIYLLVLIAILVITIISISKQKDKIIFSLLNIIILTGLLIVCSFSSIYLGLSWIEARIIYPFGSLIGLLSLNYVINHSKCNDVKSEYLKLLLVILLLCQSIGFQKIIVDKHKVTELDKQRTLVIGSEIAKFERQSGNEIKYVSFYTDKRSRDQYKGLFKSGDSCVSAYARDWSDINVINYYLGTNYSKVDNKKEIGEKLYLIDEDIFTINQLEFDGDTLHILIY